MSEILIYCHFKNTKLYLNKRVKEDIIAYEKNDGVFNSCVYYKTHLGSLELPKEFKDDLIIIDINDVDEQEFTTQYFEKKRGKLLLDLKNKYKFFKKSKNNYSSYYTAL